MIYHCSIYESRGGADDVTVTSSRRNRGTAEFIRLGFRGNGACARANTRMRRRVGPTGSVIVVNENENENGEKRENNEFVNEN